MSIKNNCKSFEKVLKDIYDVGIASKCDLQKNIDLYNEFWYAAIIFSRFALHSKTNSEKKDGEIRAGNIYKVAAIELNGINTEDGICTDCVIKMINKLDLILNQPLEKQKNYCFKLINNLVNDEFKKFPPKTIQVVSLQDFVNLHANTSDDKFTYEEIIEDNKHNPEEALIEKENIISLSKELEEKKKKELFDKQDNIIKEMNIFCNKPEYLLVRLACIYLDIKPRELAKIILSKGPKRTFELIITQTAKKFMIDNDVVNRYSDLYELSEVAVKADSNDTKTISAQISRLVYRADKTMKK